MASPAFPYSDYFNNPSYGWDQLSQNYQTPPQFSPNWATNDPQTAMKDNRTYAASMGGNLDNMLGGQQAYADQLEAFYRNPMNAEAANIAQTPGYTTDELGNITRGDQYAQGVTGADSYSQLNASDQEKAAMKGDPNSLYNFYNPDQLNSINQDSATRQRGRFGDTQGAMNANLEGTQGRLDTSIGQATGRLDSSLEGAANRIASSLDQTQGSMQSALDQQKQGYGQAINPSNLRVDAGFLPAVEGAYQQHAGAMDAATGSSKLNLNLSPQDYLMSNQELQDTVNQAGQSVQNARQSQMDAYTRAAQASGNADPMALAALATQTQNQGNEAAANAQTNAYLAAKGQQRGLAMNYAGANLAAGQTQAGMQVGAQENQMSQQLGEANAYEQMRLGAEQGLTADQMAAIQPQTGSQMGAAQYLSGAQLGSAQYLGSAGQTAGEYLGSLNTGANQYMGNARLGADQYLGSTGIGMEQGIGQQAQNTGQYLTNTGTGIAQNVNQLNTQYGNQQYQNRLQNTMYQQQNTFNQNTAIQDRQAAAYQAAANARMGGQNQFLNWSTGQVGQAVGQNQTAAQQRVGLYGEQTGAINQATGQWGNYNLAKNMQPSTFDKIAGGLIGAAGAFAGG
jgi:hypothetical protein